MQIVRTHTNKLRTIIQYSLRGDFIKIWEYGDVLNTFGSIDGNLSGRNKTAYGFIWKRFKKNYPLKIDSPIIPIQQFSVDGRLIKTWDNVKQILKTLNIKNISSCLNGKEKTAYGYVWKYETKKLKR